MPAPSTPNLVADEKTTLHAFLRYLREALIANLSDLDEADAQKTVESSGKSMVGLLKHLTVMELGWFGHAYAGQDLPQAAHHQTVEEPDTAAAVIAAYRAAAARSDAIIEAAADLDRPGVRTLRPETPEHPPLRWVMLHVIEDTARHTGHADNIRDDILGYAGPWRGTLKW
ncbi:DUF664 domain-containing protein [Kitasatospora sp. NPDC002227]|uniref:mycothiol transferase n=1 Tax=Kitasatospora sp. NPDC002227 TaxID=3154773 RepID=UPI0033315420